MDKCLILSRFSRSERPSRHLPLGLFGDLDSITGSPPREKTRSLVIPKGENSITGSPQGRRLDHWFSLKRLDWITGSPPRRITGCLPREETGSPGFPPPPPNKKKGGDKRILAVLWEFWLSNSIYNILHFLRPWRSRGSALKPHFRSWYTISHYFANCCWFVSVQQDWLNWATKNYFQHHDKQKDILHTLSFYYWKVVFTWTVLYLNR